MTVGYIPTESQVFSMCPCSVKSGAFVTTAARSSFCYSVLRYHVSSRNIPDQHLGLAGMALT